MSINDPNDPRYHRPRVEHPRVEPEIIPPNAQSRQGGRYGARDGASDRTSGGFESLFIRVEEGPDGIRRVTLKRPGPFTIIALLLGAGLLVALFFVVLAGLMLLWIPVVIAGVAFALFSGSARTAWQRMRGWWSGLSR
jgi:hypothetical protein